MREAAQKVADTLQASLRAKFPAEDVLVRVGGGGEALDTALVEVVHNGRSDTAFRIGDQVRPEWLDTQEGKEFVDGLDAIAIAEVQVSIDEQNGKSIKVPEIPTFVWTASGSVGIVFPHKPDEVVDYEQFCRDRAKKYAEYDSTIDEEAAAIGQKISEYYCYSDDVSPSIADITHGLMVIDPAEPDMVLHFCGFWEEPAAEDIEALRQEIATDEELGLTAIASHLQVLPAPLELVQQIIADWEAGEIEETPSNP